MLFLFWKPRWEWRREQFRHHNDIHRKGERANGKDADLWSQNFLLGEPLSPSAGIYLLYACIFFFTVSLKAYSPRLRSSNTLNFKTLWNACAGVFYVCGYSRKSLMTHSSLIFGGHSFCSGFWPFQCKKRHFSRNVSCRKRTETPNKMVKDEGLKISNLVYNESLRRECSWVVFLHFTPVLDTAPGAIKKQQHVSSMLSLPVGWCSYCIAILHLKHPWAKHCHF